MPYIDFNSKERTLVSSLRELVAYRDERESGITRQYKSDIAAQTRSSDERLKSLQENHQNEMRKAEATYRACRDESQKSLTQAVEELERTYNGERFRIQEQADHDEQIAKKGLDEACWTAETVYEAKEKQPSGRFDKSVKELKRKQERLRAFETQTGELLRRFHQSGAARRVPAATSAGALETDVETGSAMQQLDCAIEEASQQLARLRTSRLAGAAAGMRPYFLLLILVGAATGLVGWATEWQFDQYVAQGVIAAGVIWALLLTALYILGRKKIIGILTELQQTIERGRRARERALVDASERRAYEEAALKEQRDEDIRKAKETYQPRIAKVTEARARLLKQLDDSMLTRIHDAKQRRERELAAIDEKWTRKRHLLEEAYQQALTRVTKERDAVIRAITQQHDHDWTELEDRWSRGMAEAHQAVDDLRTFNDRHFPSWDPDNWDAWRPPFDFAQAFRFGSYEIDVESMPGGLPRDPRLTNVGAMRFSIPALLDFPSAASLLFEMDEASRPIAIDTIQSLMTRLLTTFPPGKVRFTIIDPVGLGQNFAGFMHLADYDESFVADRIWTETRHIEQRLLDLTEHMENVIQKYLRNDFETITSYNDHAGEIAEPFRFLVIADLPVNFSETAARRLISIIDSGPRCGVYTLIARDVRQPLPRDIHEDDLRRTGIVLTSKKGVVSVLDDTLGDLPLTLDPAPSADLLSSIIHRVGEAAKDNTRVEVPFRHVVPEKERYWTFTTDREVTTQLGRAGATKLQPMTLGRGIAQHMLIAGKTGSGKSTLLHVMVTSMALRYHPQEVEFYLVDFKKGVEFKTYATHNLPHARVVAIESDREFGLSVLERVDAELRRRGEIFRDLGVQDLAGYRATNPQERIPRTLLIIDEFQEFFVEDDKLAQDAGLLLDRLVRQGRAFGIHIILGSQTLAGAYSLARSTIGQMAVRVALQCSEADAMLIMSDDNTAARLLSRPGEAIYNDQSGLVEGNSPFQIVWLPEDVRDTHLREVAELTTRQSYQPPEPQIVFEGNIPADVRRNRLLKKALEERPSATTATAPHAWLGDAIAIKDPTAAVFRRQSACNLLLVGQRDEAALAMQAVGLVSLAAQNSNEPPHDAKFYVFDGMPTDSQHSGYFQSLARHLPHEILVVGWHDIDAAMKEIGEELKRRQDRHLDDAPPIYLFVYGLQRFRQLRQEEDFGFGSLGDNDPAAISSGKRFGNVLRDGPPYGIHTIAWCDSANNLSRAVDRKTLREFDMRVLFQRSSTDSSNLIDTPAASLLGTQRALFHSEDHGVLEKFRPYALPTLDWLLEIHDLLQQRSGQLT